MKTIKYKDTNNELKDLYKIYTKKNEIIDPFNGYDYIDMGDAGYWATCNIGAIKPEEYGLYFAWGETTGYANASDKSGGFTWKTTPYWVSGTRLTGTNTKWSKYTDSDEYSSDGKADNKVTLEPEDDAAHVNMGGDWRMPTSKEFLKLYDLCNNEYVSSYEGTGVRGRIFKLKTDASKQLFFPFAGGADEDFIDSGTYGHYWASSLIAKANYRSYCLSANSTSVTPEYFIRRYIGYPVRAFIPKSE